MFKNVLVGVDGRRNGHDAIALASRLADSDGTLTLAHVHTGDLRPTHAVTPGMVKEEREASEQLLERERAEAGVDAKLLSIVAMSPGRGLHMQAEEQDADLLVVGSCSHSAFGRAMLGDDTRSALNGAPCAVAIASLGYAAHPAPISKVGVGYDGSHESKAALAVAMKLAEATGAAVHVLEVVTIPTYAYTGLIPPVMGESIDAMLEEANVRLRSLTGVEGHAVYGLTGEELAAFSEEMDILVVGSRSYGPVRRLVLGSTSDYLERHGRCSLLVLPRAASVAAGEEASHGRDADADTSASSAA
ncbi:MAG: universal stress protein [Solirubrobacteraceae bacterium]|jgi:nucleotide-binding universal stress UspA family protein